MELYRPIIDLIGGPLDGATNHDSARCDWQLAVWPHGEVAARVEWPGHPRWWLLYRGEYGFQGERIRLLFVSYNPVLLTPAQ